MFDSVYVECPQCNKKQEVQSKAGDCILAEYDRYNAPVEIMKDIDESIINCTCGHIYKLKAIVFARLEIERL